MTYNNEYSLLTSQVGYHNNDVKKAYIRSALKTPAGLPDKFSVVNDDGEDVFAGAIAYWGEKWGSYWWSMDFSPVVADGKYSVKVEALQSNVFHIREDVLTSSRLDSDEQADLADIAMHQLDYRLKKFTDPEAVQIPGFEGEYIPGYRDCGSEIRELSSHVVTLHGLLDIYENKKIYDSFSVKLREKLLHQIKWVADYIVFCQEHSDNPLYNGRFNHDGGMQTDYGTTGYHNWHGTAYALTALARICNVLGNVLQCNDYIAAAELAFANATYRPYNIESDIGARTDKDGNNINSDDFTAYVNELAQQVYNKPSDWAIPMSLKTKDKLTFTWGCVQLYKATNKKDYLDTAIKFADSAIERQFTDWENPIEGAYGNFYAFEGDNEAFSLEWNQNHKFHMGNIEPTNLKGIMELYQLLPEHADAAKWYNAVKTYGEAYVKATAKLSPMGIWPLTMYADKQHGGVKYFQVTNHGAVGMYGQVAKNLLELGDFLGESEYAEYAANNLQFIAGLNPGIPTSFDEKEWQAKSMIVGLGADFFYAQHGLISAPKGSGINGFSADIQFQPTVLGTVPDAPKGILGEDGKYQFNEDYLPHSHGYASGVAVMEKPFTLTVTAKIGKTAVPAKIVAAYDNAELSITDQSITLPNMKRVTVSASYNGVTLSESFDTIGGASKQLTFDFESAIAISISAPEIIDTKEAKGIVKVVNLTNNSKQATVKLNAYGVNLHKYEFVLTLTPDKTEQSIEFVLQSDVKAMPFTVIATANVNGDTYKAYAHGKISSKPTTL